METRANAARFYDADRSFHERYWELIDDVGSRSESILELGCGRSSAVLRPALAGKRRLGIDISRVAVEQARGLGSTADFEVMDCHNLDLPDRSVALVCGSGILHHVELRVAIPEVVRVLRPGGTAVFLEPLGHNPLINLYRRLTPRFRTPDEHPLLMHDLAFVRQHLADVRVEYFGLFAPAVGILRSVPGFRVLTRVAQVVDRWALRIGPLRRWAWMAVVVGRSPDAPG